MNAALARKAQDILAHAAPAGWPRPWTEIQETELLLGVDLSSEWRNKRVTDDERRAIARALNALMPSDEPLGIWMVVVRVEGKVVDSVLANDV
jgi:hypothetical protein